MQKTDLRQTWQAAMANAITDPAELLQILSLDSAFLPQAVEAAKKFPLRVPRGFVARMQKNNPRDPLLMQVLPLGEECLEIPGFVSDPLQEQKANPVPGLLHKYHSRVLLTLAGSCGVNCRYCFRREFSYQDNNPGRQGWDEALRYIEARPEIKEVILSGGDPLIVNDAVLEKFGEKLLALPQLTTLRFHTRMPIVIPERFSDSFVQWLTNFPLRKVLVLHCNHPQEINNDVVLALAKLKNVTVLNQSVILKNINDDANTLIDLSEKLFSANVLPYYLHLLDKVNGTAHFDVTEEKAKVLIKEMQRRLPGYLVPRLVREVPGEKSKVYIV